MTYARCLLICIGCISLVMGCASFHPKPQENPPWQQRVDVATDGGVKVSVAALTPAETRDELGLRLDRHGIQPVWVKVENNEQIRYYIPPIILDQGYYSPLEAAWKGHGWFSDETNAAIDEHVRARALPAFVEPGAAVSGFIFTNLDEGVKYVSLELIGAGRAEVRRFAFVASVPGLKTDYQQVEWDKLHAPGEVRNLDQNDLREWLEQLPCCVKGGDRTSDGDPLNIVLIGSRKAVVPALARRGWHVTETTTASSTWQTIASSVFGSRYRYAPISPLYLFGRQQDIGLQKPRANVDQRNHMRLWLAPVTFNDAPVWVGQISRDIGVRLTPKTITTHKIDPDVDETRWYLVQDMFFSQGLMRFGFAAGVGAATPQAPRENYTGDPYYTDGLRAVMWMSEEPITYQRVESVPWAQMPTR